MRYTQEAFLTVGIYLDDIANVVTLLAICCAIFGLHTTKTVGLPHARGHGELYGGVA